MQQARATPNQAPQDTRNWRFAVAMRRCRGEWLGGEGAGLLSSPPASARSAAPKRSRSSPRRSRSQSTHAAKAGCLLLCYEKTRYSVLANSVARSANAPMSSGSGTGPASPATTRAATGTLVRARSCRYASKGYPRGGAP